mmetsp:Transcript_9435/g.31352  ORF Transcript_9435/g.31352 Transcript_9435/m.31352 type:complete len:231 (-) Transcript_9435:319-1011(-)
MDGHGRAQRRVQGALAASGHTSTDRANHAGEVSTNLHLVQATRDEPAQHGQRYAGRRCSLGDGSATGLGRVEGEDISRADRQVEQEQALGTPLIEFGRRSVEERVYGKGHLQLLQVQRRRVDFQVRARRLDAARTLRLLGRYARLFAVAVVAVARVVARGCILTGFTALGAIEPTDELIGLIVNRVDAVCIDLDPRIQCRRSKLEVGHGCVAARWLLNHPAHVVDQIQSP